MTDARIRLVALVGAGVAVALGVAIPREESGRRVEAAVDAGGGLTVRHLSGRQYLRVYLDIAGVATACDGITIFRGRPLLPGQSFTEARCTELLAEELVNHGQGMLACTPGLRRSPDPATELAREGPRFAAISLTYNIGVGRWCGSTARARFNAGDLAGGCTAMTHFDKVTYSRPQPGRSCLRTRSGRYACVVRGLADRRAREARICREGLAALRSVYS